MLDDEPGLFDTEGYEPPEQNHTGDTANHREPEEGRPADGINENARERAGDNPGQAKQTGEKGVLGCRKTLLSHPKEEDRKSSRSHPLCDRLESNRSIHQGPMDLALRNEDVADIGKDLEETKNPQQNPPHNCKYE